jgi:PPP family 3-phenylpropionic acid transporter
MRWDATGFRDRAMIATPARDPEVTAAEIRAGAHLATPWTLHAIYTAIGLSTASLVTFVPVILKARGLDPAAIGLVASMGALLATLVAPLWGHLADAVVGQIRAFRIGLILSSAAAVGLLLDLPLVLIAGLLATFTIYASLFMGLADSLAVTVLPAPERQYGICRAHASLSYTVGITIVGFLYTWAGYGLAPVVFMVWAGVLFVLVGRIPDRVRPAKARTDPSAPVSRRSIRLGSPGRAMAVQPRLLTIMVVFAVAFTGIQGALTFIGIRIIDLGGQPSDVALSFGVAAVAEIPGLMAAGWLGRRIGLRSLLVASLTLYGLCVASWGILPFAVAINATRAVSGLCNGSLMAARVLLVPRLLPRSLQATGQVLFQASSLGFGSVLGSVVGGMVYGACGPAIAFGAAGGVAIAGGVASWFVLSGGIGGNLTGTTPDERHLQDPLG